MMTRIGPGPVFVHESLIVARRRQLYAGRSLFVLLILLGLICAWSSSLNQPEIGNRSATLRTLASVGQSFFQALAGIQLAMVLLVAPAATAGAVCHDRAQGILAQMAITDLSAAEIVLGKLFSRLAPILGLLGCALPVMAMATMLGGVDAGAIVILFVVSAVVAVLSCSLAICVSVEVGRTQDALAAVILLWMGWLVSVPVWWGMTMALGYPPPPDWFQKLNPFVLVYGPYARPGYVTAGDVALYAVEALVLSAGLTAWAIARLRRHVLPEEVGGTRPRRLPSFRLPGIRRWLERLPGPSLDGNPVLWREWHRARPARMTRVIWGTYWLTALVMTGVGLREAIQYGTSTRAGSFLLAIALVCQVGLGLMLLSAQAPTMLGEERIRGSLDVLMATPIATWAIVWGKWLGTFRVVLGLTILPALIALALAWNGNSAPITLRGAVTMLADGSWLIECVGRLTLLALLIATMLSQGAAITSLGLVLAVWIPRPGRAIGASVATFILFALGWPFFVDGVLAPVIRAWIPWQPGSLVSYANLVLTGLVSASPLVGPMMIINGLTDTWTGGESLFCLMVFAWFLIECAVAGGLFWVALRSFDARLGRMPETSMSDGSRVPARPAEVRA